MFAFEASLVVYLLVLISDLIPPFSQTDGTSASKPRASSLNDDKKQVSLAHAVLLLLYQACLLTSIDF